MVDHQRRAERGVSVVELLVAIALLSIIGAVACSFARAAFSSMRVIEARVETRQGVVLALDSFVREMRLAGYKGDMPVTAIAVASESEVEVAADLNGDGSLTDPNERVAYRYSGSRQTFGRATGNAGAQPILRNVPPGCVSFAYFNRAGASLGAGGSLSPSDREQVHRIRLALCSKVGVDGVQSEVGSHLTLSVARRNP